MLEPIEVFALAGIALIVAFAAVSKLRSIDAAPAVFDDNTASGPSAPDIDLGSTTFSAAPSASPSDLIQRWAQAIFKREGGNPGDRNVRNNNPGNLKFAGQSGAVGQDSGGFAIFGSIEDGWAALYRQLTKYIRDFPGFNFFQIMAHYLGQSDAISPRVTDQGDPISYGKAVAAGIGVSPDSTLKNTFGG